MAVRDQVLPVLDKARAKIASLGLRRYSVTIRRRTWSGGTPGDGNATNTDTVLTPTPRVRLFSTREIAGSGGTYQQGDYRIDRITPQFAGGGYTPAQLDLPVSTEAQDIVVVLAGDDGTLICTIVETRFDEAFGYSLVVRPRRETP